MGVVSGDTLAFPEGVTFIFTSLSSYSSLLILELEILGGSCLRRIGPMHLFHPSLHPFQVFSQVVIVYMVPLLVSTVSHVCSKIAVIITVESIDILHVAEILLAAKRLEVYVFHRRGGICSSLLLLPEAAVFLASCCSHIVRLSVWLKYNYNF